MSDCRYGVSPVNYPDPTLYFGKGKLFALLYYLKFGWGIKKKQLPAVYCKLIFVAKNLIGPLSCDCKNACVFHSRQQIWRMC